MADDKDDRNEEIVELFRENYKYEGEMFIKAIKQATEKIEAAPDVFINDTIESRVSYLLKKKVNYIEKNGQIYFEYYATFGNAEREGSYLFKLKEQIPEEIQKQGKEAVKVYTRERVKGYLTTEIQKHKKDEDFQKNPDFPISIEYDGQKLQGKIILAKVRYFRVRLERPLQGEMNSYNYGYASAMAGHHIFSRNGDGDLTFSDYAIKDAEKILIKIYLVEELNHKQKK